MRTTMTKATSGPSGICRLYVCGLRYTAKKNKANDDIPVFQNLTFHFEFFKVQYKKPSALYCLPNTG
jgi:hypothetical protein